MAKKKNNWGKLKSIPTIGQQQQSKSTSFRAKEKPAAPGDIHFHYPEWQDADEQGSPLLWRPTPLKSPNQDYNYHSQYARYQRSIYDAFISGIDYESGNSDPNLKKTFYNFSSDKSRDGHWTVTKNARIIYIKFLRRLQLWGSGSINLFVDPITDTRDPIVETNALVGDEFDWELFRGRRTVVFSDRTPYPTLSITNQLTGDEDINLARRLIVSANPDDDKTLFDYLLIHTVPTSFFRNLGYWGSGNTPISMQISQWSFAPTGAYNNNLIKVEPGIAYDVAWNYPVFNPTGIKQTEWFGHSSVVDEFAVAHGEYLLSDSVARSQPTITTLVSDKPYYPKTIWNLPKSSRGGSQGADSPTVYLKPSTSALTLLLACSRFAGMETGLIEAHFFWNRFPLRVITAIFVDSFHQLTFGFQVGLNLEDHSWYRFVPRVVISSYIDTMAFSWRYRTAIVNGREVIRTLDDSYEDNDGDRTISELVDAEGNPPADFGEVRLIGQFWNRILLGSSIIG